MELKFVTNGGTTAMEFVLDELTIGPLLGTLNTPLTYPAPSNMLTTYDPEIKLEYNNEPNRLVNALGFNLVGRAPFVLYFDTVRNCILVTNDVSPLIATDGNIIAPEVDIIKFAEVKYLTGRGNIDDMYTCFTADKLTQLPSMDSTPDFSSAVLHALPLPLLADAAGTGNSGFMEGNTYREEGFSSGILVLDITDCITGSVSMHAIAYDGKGISFNRATLTATGEIYNSGGMGLPGIGTNRRVFITI